MRESKNNRNIIQYVKYSVLGKRVGVGHLVLAVLHQEEERRDGVARALLRMLASVAQKLQSARAQANSRCTEA